jgi:hypothetical protein
MYLWVLRVMYPDCYGIIEIRCLRGDGRKMWKGASEKW